ncbi:hypothetical protein [Rhodosalinus sp.]|uniref:hypothetical protein n=1 Tax=Rhodosalinus sp. TaxID=2047741 RepID=UPI003979104A
MRKRIAIVDVFALSGVWALGHVALAPGPASQGQTVMATAIALAGLVTGLAAWIWAVRRAEATGHAWRSCRMPPEKRENAQAEWGKTDALS